MNIAYTYMEQIKNKYTVNDAIKAAKFILKDKYNVNASDVYLKHIDFVKVKITDPITLVELNNMSDKIINLTKQIKNIKY